MVCGQSGIFKSDIEYYHLEALVHVGQISKSDHVSTIAKCLEEKAQEILGEGKKVNIIVNLDTDAVIPRTMKHSSGKVQGNMRGEGYCVPLKDRDM